MFIFIDKDPKWTKLKTIQGQPKNGTYLKSGDSLFYGENGAHQQFTIKVTKFCNHIQF